MPSSLRALHVAAGNLYGGVETFLATLARYQAALPELSSEFALCFEGRLANELRAAGARVHSLGVVRLRNPLSVGRANYMLLRILRASKYDVVVTHGAWPHVVSGPLVRALGYKLVTWGHGAPLNPGLLDRLSDTIEPDLLIANSHYTANAYQSSFPGVPRRVIYYPVAENRKPTRSRQEVRRQLATPEDATVILYAARLERWKGHALLLRACRLLTERRKLRFFVWLCGGVQRPQEEAYLAELTTYVGQHGLGECVRFLGQRADVTELMGAADLFCQPNIQPEPFGIVFVEALYAGLPVVSTDMGGAHEIVDASCGILTPPTEEALANALAELIDNRKLRGELAAGAPQRATRLCEPLARMRDVTAAIRDV